MENNKYQRGKIYKIVDNTTNKSYRGSTCEPILARRLAGHVSDYKRYLTGKSSSYITSFSVLKNEYYNIILIENYPCNSKDELFARESYWSKEIDCVNFNKNQGLIAKLGKKVYQDQYRIENKDHEKNYYIENRDHIKNRVRKYVEKNFKNVKEYQDQYRIEHKEKSKEYFKQFYITNKAKLEKIRYEKYICLCGGHYIYSQKSIHYKSNKHQQFFNIKNHSQIMCKIDEILEEVNNFLEHDHFILYIKDEGIDF
jgi:hypothetical protein